MKTTIVPAQITTVEDKIAGNLTLQQMILLTMPVFIDFALYAVLPHPLKLNAYKLGFMAVVSIVCGLLAIRVRGKILFSWAITVVHYNTRPRYYVFNKNDGYLRSGELPTMAKAKVHDTEEGELVVTPHMPTLSPEEVMKLEEILAHPAANLSFKLQKGGLHVSITEVK